MGSGFLIPYAVGGNLTALAKEHKAVGAVPILNNVQPLVDFSTERLRTQVETQEYCLDGTAKLRERLVRGVCKTL